MDIDIEKLKYPTGKYQKVENPDRNVIEGYIEAITKLPEKLNGMIGSINDERVDWRYRPGGWTVRQVVHHIAESHVNAFCRLKLALTESTPVIKTYHEDRWAELIDSKQAPIESSLEIIKGTHARWALILSNMTDEDFKRTFFHPESGINVRLDHNTGLYAWHGNHHAAQINQALESGVGISYL